MVFANLQANEKDAFFSLLDEYFQSRPEIFAASSANSQDVSGVAASAVHRAMANNPEATAKIVSAGLRQAAGQTKSPGGAGAGAGAGAGGTNASSENDMSSIAGRVAAASIAFSNRHNPSPSSSSTSPPPVADKPSSFSSVRQKFGEVDTSSPKNLFGSLRGSTAASKTTSPPPPQAPAPAARQNNIHFPPPPTRHNPPPPPPFRQQPEEEEEEQQGEWANVLYDYDSGEAGDLVIKEGQRVLVTERTSDDWWTGELNGKKGLFPASYVEQL
ncbi:hypothetical protein K443DRAFT_673250 [Laccaria amethystina LaAM-08-1]|uniref:SH3 domain-containing protein n=1 Tax=Laccaria amethystina LaAM-08-1 TaxID=1095629 RepID=A0A0C9Y191_9AGAR|nr:hypothetical protein K443DRAFT_673250 [Laccaria amethystina LaAM-08-1]